VKQEIDPKWDLLLNPTEKAHWKDAPSEIVNYSKEIPQKVKQISTPTDARNRNPASLNLEMKFITGTETTLSDVGRNQKFTVSRQLSMIK
jgi:hypothetical protein